MHIPHRPLPVASLKLSVRPLAAPRFSPRQSVGFSGHLRGEDPSIRIVGGIQNGERYVSGEMVRMVYLRWNEKGSAFELVYQRSLCRDLDIERRDPSTYLEHVVPLSHGEMLSGDLSEGTVVDALNQRLIFADGRWMDGPTGDLYTAQNVLILSRDSKRHPKPPTVKDL